MSRMDELPPEYYEAQRKAAQQKEQKKWKESETDTPEFATPDLGTEADPYERVEGTVEDAKEAAEKLLYEDPKDFFTFVQDKGVQEVMQKSTCAFVALAPEMMIATELLKSCDKTKSAEGIEDARRLIEESE